jgi:hypothetical protein
VESTGWAALHVAERTWSPNQTITKIDNDRIRLEFSASSDVELIAWILSFGEAARVKAPDWLVGKILEKSENIFELYSITKKSPSNSLESEGLDLHLSAISVSIDWDQSLSFRT